MRSKLMIAATVIAGAMISMLGLNGCAIAPTMKIVSCDGIEIVEHIDDERNLPSRCEEAYPRGGCYEYRSGKHHIWYSSVSMPYVRTHEIAHAKGMLHSAWTYNGGESCAIVMSGADSFRAGEQICIGQRGEYRSNVNVAVRPK